MTTAENLGTLVEALLLQQEPVDPAEVADILIKQERDEDDEAYVDEDAGDAFADEEPEMEMPNKKKSKKKRDLVVATKSGSGKRRRGEVFHCKHGCGYTYTRKPGVNDRSARDAYDYHETQGCQLLPRLLCPLGCNRRGRLVSFGGIKALRNHYKSKGHIEKMAEQGITEMDKLSAVEGPPDSVPKLEVSKKEKKKHIERMRKMNEAALGRDAALESHGDKQRTEAQMAKKRKKRQAKRERKAKRAKARVKRKLEHKMNAKRKREKSEDKVKLEASPAAAPGDAPVASAQDAQAFQAIFEHMYAHAEALDESAPMGQAQAPPGSSAAIAPATSMPVSIVEAPLEVPAVEIVQEQLPVPSPAVPVAVEATPTDTAAPIVAAPADTAAPIVAAPADTVAAVAAPVETAAVAVESDPVVQ